MTKEKKTIRQLRVENRYTMRAISEATGIPYGTYVAYDCGYRKTSLSAAQKIAAFYGLNVDDIDFSVKE